MDPQRQKILQGIQQNSPLFTGVEFKFGFPDEAVSFFASLSANTNVKNLKAYGDGLDEKAAPSLAACLAATKSLTYLDFGNSPINLEGMIELSKGLRENKSLKALRIGPLGKKTGNGLEHILTGIIDKRMISRLELINIPINDTISFAKSFAKYLPRSFLTYLCLDSLGLNDEALAIITPALLQCRTLSTILLYRHKTTAMGTKALLKQLGGFSGLPLRRIGLNGSELKSLESLTTLLPERGGLTATLRELDLSGCKITNDGAVVIFQSIVQNKPLSRIDLSDNEILNLRSLNLGKNTTNLTDLNLSGNKLSEESLSQLAQELPLNRSLTRLNISRNSFSPESAKQFLNPVILALSKLRELQVDAKGPPIILQGGSSSSSVSPNSISPSMSRSTSSKSISEDFDTYSVMEAQLSAQLAAGSRVPTRMISHSFSAGSLSNANTPLGSFKASPVDMIAVRTALLPEILDELEPFMHNLVAEYLFEHAKTKKSLQGSLVQLQKEISDDVVALARSRLLGE